MKPPAQRQNDEPKALTNQDFPARRLIRLCHNGPNSARG
jgi:hypothetical protein